MVEGRSISCFEVNSSFFALKTSELPTQTQSTVPGTNKGNKEETRRKTHPTLCTAGMH